MMTDRNKHKEPICAWSDLPTRTCAHCAGTTNTITITWLEHTTGRPQPQYRPQPRPEPHQWAITDPQPTSCTGHTRPPGQQLCHDCRDLLTGLLEDTPHITRALAEARTKDTRFADHGGHLERDPDEATLPVNLAATKLLHELDHAIPRHNAYPLMPLPDAAAWCLRSIEAIDQATVLEQLSRIAAAAHHLIDIPAGEIYLGTCPKCGRDLHGHRGQPVACPTQSCYAASWDDHQHTQLEAALDRPVTLGQLIGVLQRNGRPVTRQQLKNLINRKGIPRTRDNQPHWDNNGYLVTNEVWVYTPRDFLPYLDTDTA